jgi:hypothetical protein
MPPIACTAPEPVPAKQTLSIVNVSGKLLIYVVAAVLVVSVAGVIVTKKTQNLWLILKYRPLIVGVPVEPNPTKDGVNTVPPSPSKTLLKNSIHEMRGKPVGSISKSLIGGGLTLIYLR